MLTEVMNNVLFLLAEVTFGLVDLSIAPGGFALQNEHLAVTFRKSDAGPRLTMILHRATGQTYQFDDSQEIMMALLQSDAINDPELNVQYEIQNGFRFESVAVDNDKTNANLIFSHRLLRAEVIYELQPDAPVLRKSIVCTAGESGAYVAGVMQWMLKPVGLSLEWPRNNAVGQPAILLAPNSGCFLTLEWPQSRVTSVNDDVRIEYRPGYQLAANQSLHVGSCSIGFFDYNNGRESGCRPLLRKPRLPHPKNRCCCGKKIFRPSAASGTRSGGMIGPSQWRTSPGAM